MVTSYWRLLSKSGVYNLSPRRCKSGLSWEPEPGQPLYTNYTHVLWLEFWLENILLLAKNKSTQQHSSTEEGYSVTVCSIHCPNGIIVGCLRRYLAGTERAAQNTRVSNCLVFRLNLTIHTYSLIRNIYIAFIQYTCVTWIRYWLFLEYCGGFKKNPFNRIQL